MTKPKLGIAAKDLEERAGLWSDSLVQRGAHGYDRSRDAARLLPALFAYGMPDRFKILAYLQGALLRERRLGQSGHWSYDLARHARLAQALTAECLASADQPEAPAPETKSAAPSGGANRTRTGTAAISARDGVADPGPSPWRDASGRPHSWAPPSGSQPEGPTSRDTAQATCCIGCADGA